MGTVLVPEWLKKSHVPKGALVSSQSRTLAYKLANLESAFEDLKAEIEKGVIVERPGPARLRPMKLIRSIEGLLVKRFGTLNASNLLYEIEKEAGRHSVTVVEKDIGKVSSVYRFQQVFSCVGMGEVADEKFQCFKESRSLQRRGFRLC